MAFYDLNEEELRRYRPEVQEPSDFDEFWATTLEETARFPLDVTVTPIATDLDLVESYDVEFSGFGGHRIKAWLTMPRGAGPRSLPAVVSYVGYGGGRGLPQEHLVWANAGFAHLHMDTRGQGSRWGVGGHTPDPSGTGPSAPGFMTRGIEDPHTYYYRRVITDAVRAKDVAAGVAQVDPTRITVTGVSQGGGLALAVGGLVPNLLAVMPDVPFLCNFRRATDITDSTPYAEITGYLAVHRRAEGQVFNTLSYFDGVNFSRRATAPALFSVALMDPVCPPSTVFSAYNVYGSEQTEIEVYRYNQHEGGMMHQVLLQLSWLRPRAGLASHE